MWEVIVGNVGTVHSGETEHVARSIYREYVANSKAGVGRVAGEPVTLVKGGEIAEEYQPPGEDK